MSPPRGGKGGGGHKPDGEDKTPFAAVDTGLVAHRDEISVGGAAITSSGRIEVNASLFVGPLPKPDVLEHYERIYPGAAALLFKSLEQEGQHRRAEVLKENEHRRELEVLGTRAAIATEERGQKFGFAALMTTILGGGGLLLAGVQAAGIAMVITALVAMLGAALWRRFDERRARRDEEAEEAREIEEGKEAAPQRKADGSKVTTSQDHGKQPQLTGSKSTTKQRPKR